MSDTPKFTVIDRRKFREDSDTPTASETTPEQPKASEPAQAATSTPAPGPRLVVTEPVVSEPASPEPEASVTEIDTAIEEPELPAGPTAEDMAQQKISYDAASERLDDLIRAQNPAAPAPEKIGFEHLAQQFYLSAMMQMGAGTPDGQRPRVDIVGARQTIELLGIITEKTRGNLTPTEQQLLDTMLFDLRMAFLELTQMISISPPTPGGPAGGIL